MGSNFTSAINKSQNWKWSTLGEVAEFINGDRGKNYPGPLDRVEIGIPFINTGHIEPTGRLNDSKMEYITREKYNKLGSGKVKPGDIVYCLRGSTIGKTAKNSYSEGAIASSLIIIRAKYDICQDYLYYFLISPVGQSLATINDNGSAQPNLSGRVLASYPLKIPNFQTQVSIAKILNDFDKKIELNRQTNQTLEQMAQTLFKSWFVDFDPVFDNLLAKANYQLANLPADFPEELHPKAVTRLAALRARIPTQEHENERLASGNDSDNAGLPHSDFPSEFEFNEQLGWVPLGWEVKTIDGLCNINPQSWTKKNAPESVKYIDLANAKNGAVGEVVEYIFEDAPSRARRMLQPYDTIIGVVRPANRSFAYINEDGLTGSTGFAVVRAKKEIYRAFSYLSLTNDDCIQEFTRIADGAAYPAIKPEDVAKANCVFSNDIILEKFEYIVGQLMEKIAANEKQIKSLTKLRDTLLPKLITGELPIPALEPRSHALRGNA